MWLVIIIIIKKNVVTAFVVYVDPLAIQIFIS